MNAMSSFSGCLRSVCCFHRLCRKKSNVSAFEPLRAGSTDSPEGNISQKISDVSKSALSNVSPARSLLADLHERIKNTIELNVKFKQGDVQANFVDEVLLLEVPGFHPTPIWYERALDMLVANLVAIVQGKLEASNHPDGPGYPVPAFVGVNNNLFGFPPSDEGKAANGSYS